MSAAQLIDDLDKQQPALILLAEAVSLAVVVDRPLLRAARTAIPGTDASLEADLWFSRLVRTRSPEGLTFAPEAAAILRQRLASKKTRLEEAWTRTQQMHAHLPPTLKLEEKIAYLSVSKSPDATAEIEELLQSVLAAMVDGGRDALANWTARAFTNFPTSVRELDSARMLDAGARIRLGAEVPDLDDDLALVAPPTLPRTNVGVRLTASGVEVDASVEPQGEPLPLPQTRPLLLTVSWTARDGSFEARQIALQPGERTLVETDAEEVELRAINGERYQLRRSGSAPASVAKYVIPFDDVLERHADFVGREAELQQLRHTSRETGDVIVVTGVTGSGKTALLAELVRRLRNEVVCLAHFFQEGTPRYSYYRAAERSLIAQLVAHFDLPPWTVSMRLFEVLTQFSDQIEARVVIVLDDLDHVDRFYTPEDVLGPFHELPPQFTVVASTRKAIRQSSVRHVIELGAPTIHEITEYLDVPRRMLPESSVHFGDLHLFKRTQRFLKIEHFVSDKERFHREVEHYGGERYARFLHALAVARAPLPMNNAVPLARTLGFEFPPETPSLSFLVHFGDESIAFVSDYAKVKALQFLGKENEARAHHDLASAVALEGNELSWYGLLHGPYHWTQAGTPAPELALNHHLVRRSVETFGAEVALDFTDDVLQRDFYRVSQSLRSEAATLERHPADTAAILYAAARRAKVAEKETIALVHITPEVVPLRLREAPEGTGSPDHLPAAIAGITSAAGERLLVRLDARELAIVQHSKGHERQLLAGHAAPVTAVAQFATEAVSGARDGSICFWDIDSGRLLAQHEGHFDAVTAVVMGANYAVSCGADGTCAVWLLAEGDASEAKWRLETRLRAPAAITAATALPETTAVAVGCSDGSVGIVNGEWKDLGRFHTGPVRAMAARRGVLATAGQDRMLRLYGVYTERPADAVPSGHELGISGMSFSDANGALVTWSADRTARIWAVERLREPLAVIRHHSAITAAAWAEEDDPWSGPESLAAMKFPLLVTASADGEMRLLDVGTRQSRWMSVSHTRTVRSIVVAGDVVHAAGDDRLIRSHDLRTGAERTAGARVTQCAYLEKTRMLVHIAGEVVRTRPLDAAQWSAYAAPTRHVTMNDRAVFISREESGRAAVFMVGHDGTEAYVDLDAELTTIAVTASGKVGMAFGNGYVYLPFASYQHDAAITELALHDFSALAGTIDGALLHLEPPTGGSGELTNRHAKIAEHPIRVTSMAMDEEGSLAVSGALDGSIFVADLLQHRATRGEPHAAAVVQCAFADSAILTASDDGTLAIRDYDGKCLATCKHHDRVTAFGYDRRIDRIYTASLDRTIRAWTFDGEPRGTFYGATGFTAVAAIPGGVLAGDDAGNVWLLDDLLLQESPA